MSKSENDQ